MSRLLIMALVLFALGCSSSDKAESAKQEAPPNVRQVEMQAAAKMLVSDFMVDLKGELMKAMKEGGAVKAISVCQIKAPEIADGFSQGKWSIKRVTEKPRNQLNRANAHEQEILRMFADSVKQGGFFDEWADVENESGYTFYQPIKMGRFCLKCHGQAIDESVNLALQDKYPDDKAIGYNAGDLRGMFVVSIETREDAGQSQRKVGDSL